MKHISQILPRVIADIEKQYREANGMGNGIATVVTDLYSLDSAPMSPPPQAREASTL